MKYTIEGNTLIERLEFMQTPEFSQAIKLTSRKRIPTEKNVLIVRPTAN